MIKWCEPEGTPVIALVIKMKGHNEQKFVLSSPNETYKYQKRILSLILEWEEKEKYRKAKNILK